MRYRERLLMGVGFFLGDGNVPDLVVMVVYHSEHTKDQRTVHFKIVNFILHELYLNKQMNKMIVLGPPAHHPLLLHHMPGAHALRAATFIILFSGSRTNQHFLRWSLYIIKFFLTLLRICKSPSNLFPYTSHEDRYYHHCYADVETEIQKYETTWQRLPS